MVKEKLWKHVYKDAVKTVQVSDELDERTVDSITAEHHPGWNAPIIYDPDGKTCFIYSDKEITGLELVGENCRLGE